MATDTDRLVVVWEAKLRDFERQMNRGSASARANFRKMEADASRFEQRFRAAGLGAARGLMAPLAGIGAALSVRQIAGLADGWTRVGNSLRVAGVPAAEMEATLDRLFGIAQGAGTALEPTVALFAKLSQSAKELGATQEQLFDFTKGVGDALRVAGTDAGAASGALQQLGQALGGSIVRAEEFNSILEGATPIVQTVANGLDEAGGSLSRLRTLVVDGKVTSQAFFEAFLRGSQGLAAQAETATATIAQGFQKVENAFLKYIGQTDQGLSASQRLTEGLTLLADNFEQTADVALKVAGIIASALLGRAIGGMLAQIPLAVGAIGTLIAAMRLGTATAGLFALSLGPIGAVLLGVGAAVYFLSDAHVDASEAATTHQTVMAGLEGALYAARAASGGLIDALVAEADAHYGAAEAAIAHARANADAQAQEAYFKDRPAGIPGTEWMRGPDWLGNQVRQEMAPVYAELDAAEARFKEAAATRRQIGIATSFADAFAAPPAMLVNDPVDAPVTDSGGGGGGGRRGGGGGAVRDLADAYSELTPEIDAAEAAQDAFNTRLEETKQVAGDALKGFIDDLIQGKSAAEALGGVLQKIASKLIDSGVDSLIGGIFGGGGGGAAGGGGGLLASLFGGARAMGGPVNPGRAYLVGERGPELFAPRMAGVIVPNRQGGGQQTARVEIGVRRGEMFEPYVVSTAGQVSTAVVKKNAENQREMQRRRG